MALCALVAVLTVSGGATALERPDSLGLEQSPPTVTVVGAAQVGGDLTAEPADFAVGDVMTYAWSADGVPLTIDLTLLDTTKNCAAGTGMAIYVWHCDRAGNYSLYSQDAAEQNYLRGVQVADANGRVSFTSIFPACYPGRWPHIHFEIYPSLEDATSATKVIRSSSFSRSSRRPTRATRPITRGHGGGGIRGVHSVGHLPVGTARRQSTG